MAVEYRLGDYKVLDFFVKYVDLTMDLTKEPVQSTALLTIRPNPEVKSREAFLRLDCKNIQIESIVLNDKVLNSPEDYVIEGDVLIIKNVPQDSEGFTIKTINNLGTNPDLFGFYTTAGTGLVKAETEGMRRVYPGLDRPDNLATYKTTIIANKKQYPTLLSNGVLVEKAELDDGIHSVTYLDVIPKPTYLFAMVAGNLKSILAMHTTQTGRELPVTFHVPEDAIEKCSFAIKVLLAAMRWDEKNFKLECPLPSYNVAGVDQYASGASEPTGLNLFNTANLFATAASRTDTDILRVLEVVAHEFFHTWTGDLVTIRDWFNLVLKEGLTTFRALMFLESLIGVDLDRMFNGHVFDERAPRPEKYTEVRSLYTSAAYEKGAEIFRMMMISLSDDPIQAKEQFFNAITTFLQNNVGKAATIEEFLESLQQSTAKEKKSFLNWFTKSGVPVVTVTDAYDIETETYTLKFTTKNRAGRPIPVSTLLLGFDGQPITKETTLMLDKDEVEFAFKDVYTLPTPSLFRGLSAPVRLEYNYSTHQLLSLMQDDDDLYNKCKAAKLLMTQMIRDYCSGKEIALEPEFITAYRNILNNSDQNTWQLAELFALPSEEALINDLPGVDFNKISEGRRFIQVDLASALKEDLQRAVIKCKHVPDTESTSLFDISAAGNRRLKAVCQSYLLTVMHSRAMELSLLNQFNDSLGKNMTETISALTLLADMNSNQLDSLLERYYEHWKHDSDAINYWFNLQVSAHTPEVLKRVTQLKQHPAFDLSNPNKVYALFGAFIKNPYGFHAASGDGYKLVATTILELEKINPSLAANLTDKFNQWPQYDKVRQALMLESLKHISKNATTSDGVTWQKRG